MGVATWACRGFVIAGKHWVDERGFGDLGLRSDREDENSMERNQSNNHS